MAMRCPYCGSGASLRDSEIVYGRSYGLIWLCDAFPKCDAYVGVHEGTKEPLGIMANAELREWKKKAHAAFDPLWKVGPFSRSQAYRLLQELLSMTEDEAHIGNMGIEDCKSLVNKIEFIVGD